jgi:hypothetical protein
MRIVFIEKILISIRIRGAERLEGKSSAVLETKKPRQMAGLS